MGSKKRKFWKLFKVYLLPLVLILISIVLLIVIEDDNHLIIPTVIFAVAMMIHLLYDSHYNEQEKLNGNGASS